MREPENLAVVFGRHGSHHAAGMFWHRDDHEGHCDPHDDPQRWWSHDSELWMSWGEIVAFASANQLQLIIVEPPAVAEARGYRKARLDAAKEIAAEADAKNAAVSTPYDQGIANGMLRAANLIVRDLEATEGATR